MSTEESSEALSVARILQYDVEVFYREESFRKEFGVIVGDGWRRWSQVV
jgi:hypothetical protein